MRDGKDVHNAYRIIKNGLTGANYYGYTDTLLISSLKYNVCQNMQTNQASFVFGASTKQMNEFSAPSG